MSEQLSRVKSRQKKSQEQPPAKGKKINRRTSTESGQPAVAKQPLATLSRKGRRSAAPAEAASERGNKGEESTPSRSETYSSERVRLSKMFVNSLIFIFVLLLAFLLWWGIEGAPPLRTLW